MKKLYKKEKISEKLHKTMIEVIEKYPNLQHLETIMNLFEYTQTITDSFYGREIT